MKLEALDIAKLFHGEHPYKVFQKSIGKSFPMVIWRLPNEKERTAIVDLRPEISTNDTELYQRTPGFILNPFEAQHPINPTFIKADILLKTNHDRETTSFINPVIGAEAIDRWKNEIEEDVRLPVLDSFNDVSKFQEQVQLAKKAISNNEFGKVVLSRFQDIMMDEDLDPFDLFEKADEKYPNAFIYLLYHPDWGLWFGATPESIISIEDDSFKTVALAGTQKLSEDKQLNEIAWTQKEIEEQAFVSRYIIDCFKKIRLREFNEYGPKTIKAGKLAHLKTEYLVDMKEVNMPNLGDIMLELLHPTSAVCGMPLMESLQFIHQYEGYNRELYAGFLGPVNVESKTEIFVNLRCMKVGNHRLRLFAGAGITEDSDPEKEFQETELKMNTMKDLLN